MLHMFHDVGEANDHTLTIGKEFFHTLMTGFDIVTERCQARFHPPAFILDLIEKSDKRRGLGQVLGKTKSLYN